MKISYLAGEEREQVSSLPYLTIPEEFKEPCTIVNEEATDGNSCIREGKESQ